MRDSYAITGRYDVINIFECTDPLEMAKVAMIIRSYGHSTTETLEATPWEEFLKKL